MRTNTENSSKKTDSRLTVKNANNEADWKRLYTSWSRYVISATLIAEEPKNYQFAFNTLYFSLRPQERVLINAAIAGDKATLQRSIVPKLRERNRLLAIAACHGDIKLLKTLHCSFLRLRHIALIQYSSKAENRQRDARLFLEAT